MHFVDNLCILAKLNPKAMLLTITISITVLIAINFLLLAFSCNKIEKRIKVDKKPVILRPDLNIEEEHRLAPTGS